MTSPDATMESLTGTASTPAATSTSWQGAYKMSTKGDDLLIFGLSLSDQLKKLQWDQNRYLANRNDVSVTSAYSHNRSNLYTNLVSLKEHIVTEIALGHDLESNTPSLMIVHKSLAHLTHFSDPLPRTSSSFNPSPAHNTSQHPYSATQPLHPDTLSTSREAGVWVSSKGVDIVNFFGDPKQDKVTPRQWADSIESAGRVGMWTESVLIEQARRFLTGPAANWVHVRVAKEPEIFHSWEVFRARFIKAFTLKLHGPDDLMKPFTHKFTQLGKGSVMRTFEEIYRDSEDFVNEQLDRSQLVDSVSRVGLLLALPLHIRQTLYSRGQANLDPQRIAEIADEIHLGEAAQKGVSINQVDSFSPADDAEDTDPHVDRIQKRLPNQRGRGTYRNKSTSGPPPKTPCHYCHQIGHWARLCPQRPEQPSQSNSHASHPKPGKTRSVSTIQASTINNVRAKSSFGKRKHVELFCHRARQTVNFTFDSGADISVMSSTTFERLNAAKQLQLLPNDVNASSCTGLGFQIIGKFMARWSSVHLPDKKVSTFFVYVSPSLSDDALLGIDAIDKLQLEYRNKQICSIQHSTSILPNPFSLQSKQTRLIQHGGTPSTLDLSHGVPPGDYILTVNHPELRVVGAVVTITHHSSHSFPVLNDTDGPVLIRRGEEIAVLEPFPAQPTVRAVHVDTSDQATDNVLNVADNHPCPKNKRKYLLANLKMGNLPPSQRDKVIRMILFYHLAFSAHENDLGKCDAYQHQIHLKNRVPVFSKQFRVPEAHRRHLIDYASNALQADTIERTTARYNSPVFLVPKKGGKHRVVVDYRKVNAVSEPDLYAGPTVDECIEAIGRHQSKLFSTFDLSQGFHQMILHPDSRPATAFTIPGFGSFQYKRAPFGLLGCPASFSRLMAMVTTDLPKTEAYIDDVLIHSTSFDEQLWAIEAFLQRIILFNLKLNIAKCEFFQEHLEYLGYRIGKDGVRPGTDKAQTIKDAPPPRTTREVQSFVGLANYFRSLIPHFSAISSPLTQLSSKQNRWGWTGGDLPQPALQAFNKLKTMLSQSPCVAYPDASKTFHLYVDAATGTAEDASKGGLGAVLMQQHGTTKRAIGYASRALRDHERNYTPYLAEMAAAVFGIEHFAHHLLGRHFVLYTDHKPLESLTVRQKKTFHRLEELMGRFSFDLKYLHGKQNVLADYASRYALLHKTSPSAQSTIATVHLHSKISALQLNPTDPNAWAQKQAADDETANTRAWVEDNTLPHTSITKRFGDDLRVHDNVLYKLDGIKRLIVVPPLDRPAILQLAHGPELTGHLGQEKTTQRIMQNYWWFGVFSDARKFVESCDTCQRAAHPPTTPNAPLEPLPQEAGPNFRVHMDLFGPLILDRGCKYVMVMTDAFTKYVVLTPLSDKTSTTVIEAFFNNWVCTFGTPRQIVSDAGREFCNRVLAGLCEKLGIQQNMTTPFHPQSNGQAEVFNKTIGKYLRSYVESNHPNWVDMLHPLAFMHNSAIHRATGFTPASVMFSFDPRYPGFDPTHATLYGEAADQELLQRMHQTHEMVRQRNEHYREGYRRYHNEHTRPHQLQVGDKVLLYEPAKVNTPFARKMQRPYTGPYTILEFVRPKVVDLRHDVTGRLIRANVERVKPYRSRDAFNDQPPTTPPGDEPPLDPADPLDEDAPQGYEGPPVPSSPAQAPTANAFPSSTAWIPTPGTSWQTVPPPIMPIMPPLPPPPTTASPPTNQSIPPAPQPNPSPTPAPTPAHPRTRGWLRRQATRLLPDNTASSLPSLILPLGPPLTHNHSDASDSSAMPSPLHPDLQKHLQFAPALHSTPKLPSPPHNATLTPPTRTPVHPDRSLMHFTQPSVTGHPPHRPKEQWSTTPPTRGAVISHSPHQRSASPTFTSPPGSPPITSPPGSPYHPSPTFTSPPSTPTLTPQHPYHQESPNPQVPLPFPILPDPDQHIWQVPLAMSSTYRSPARLIGSDTEDEDDAPQTPTGPTIPSYLPYHLAGSKRTGGTIGDSDSSTNHPPPQKTTGALLPQPTRYATAPPTDSDSSTARQPPQKTALGLFPQLTPLPTKGKGYDPKLPPLPLLRAPIFRGSTAPYEHNPPLDLPPSALGPPSHGLKEQRSTTATRSTSLMHFTQPSTAPVQTGARPREQWLVTQQLPPPSSSGLPSRLQLSSNPQVTTTSPATTGNSSHLSDSSHP